MTELDFREVNNIIEKNNKYEDEKKRKEEKDRITNEPAGDWQSPSDAKRWEELYIDIEKTRLTYNIVNNKSEDDSKKEKQILENAIQLILDETKRINDLINTLTEEIEKKPKTLTQKAYSVISGKDSNYEKTKYMICKYGSNNSKLNSLLQTIYKQLTYYNMPKQQNTQLMG